MNTGTLILAAFVTPALAWGGAVAMAAPIIIHLLARRRFRRIRWAAMEFLLDAEKRNRRRVRIEELILLALRCLAVLLVGLLVARPFVKPSGVAALFGGRERTERVFVLDDSFSMGYLTDGVSAFARAKTSVVNLLQRLREHAPDDTVTVLRASQVDKPFVAGALLDDDQTERLLAQLEALQPSQAALRPDATIAGVCRSLEADPEIVSAAVYLISDFQRVDWVEGGAGGASLAEPLKNWAGTERAVRLMLIDVGDDAAENLAVTQLDSGQRQMVTGVEARIEARVGNFSRGDAVRLDLDVVTDQTARATVHLERAAAGASTPLAIPAVFQRAADATVRVELPPDNLPIDNARTLAVEVNEALRILVVDGEPSNDTYADETHLLVAALRSEGEVFSGNRVDVVDEAQLDTASLDAYHLVMLCNLYRVSEPVADALHPYVFSGGGLAIFLGDQVSDPVVYNAALYRRGEGLLPAELESIRTAPDAGVALTATDFLHPVVRVFAGQDNPFRERIRFSRYYVTEPAVVEPDGEGAADSAAFRPAANVLARFSDAETTPAIVERAYGRGWVMLFASTCDLEWNDWARDPSYVVAMLEVAQHLARASDTNRSGLIGEPLVLDIDPARYEPSAVVRSPGYPQQQEEEITATAVDTGGMRFAWPHTETAGVYSFTLRRRDGAAETRKFAVNLDARESDLAPAAEDELRRALAGVPLDYVAGPAAAQDESDEGRKELWPALVIAVIGVLMLEQLLAWRFGRG